MGEVEWSEEQKKVINLRDRNILVSAAAGSGKTAVLVERIITMISDETKPVDIDRLLVVTFTRAAAAEMRNRVGEAIDKMLENNPDSEHLQRQATLLHNAQITTIDSFCQNIIRNYFHVIDLDPVFRVGDENDLAVVKSDIIKELLEEKYAESKENGNQEFLRFTDAFAPGRTDSNIEELVLRLYQISMSYPWPEEWLKKCAAMYQCDSLEELESADWIQELTQYIGDMAVDYREQAERASKICEEDDGPSQYEDAIKSDINQIEMIQQAKGYAQLYEAFLKLNPARLSAKRDASVSADKKEKVKSIRESYMKNGLVNLKNTFFYQSPEEMIKDIMYMSSMVKELIALTLDFAEAFSQKKREDGILDFSDMEHYALKILTVRESGQVRPSDVARELQDYYEEIMTDEYQDSNFVQELLLTSLCRAPEEKPYLFMVGDVKQSIYQFRLARPELFMEKYNSYTLKESAYQRIDLHQNFRSRAGVLESANFIFKKIMQESIGGIVYDEAASLVPAKKYNETDKRTAGKTKVMLIEQNGDENDELIIEKRAREAAAIGQEIRNIVQGDNPLYIQGKEGYRKAEYRDIAILLRSVSGWSEEFIEILTDMGIPAYSDIKTGYFSAIEVTTVLDFLHIIDNPRQDIPLAAVLRSCIVGLTDNELACLAALPRTLNYWDEIQYFIRGEHLEKMALTDSELEVLQKKLGNFYEMLERYRQMAKYLSVYEILQHIYKETDYYNIMSAMPAGEKRAANLDILLQQSIEFAENGHQGIFGFTHYIESLNKSNIDFGEALIANEKTNAVRIMSIHKSKGLQFPVVFVAGLGKKFNLQDARKATIIDADYGIGADFVNLELRVKQPTLMKKFMANQIKRNVLAEEIRILYVALTRAEEQLILTGTAADVDKKVEKWQQKSEKIDMSVLFGAQTYFDWIMPALYSKNCDNLFEINQVYQEQIIDDEKEELEKSLITYEMLQEFDTDRIYNSEMENAIRQQTEYVYPFAKDTELPVKMSVSEIKRMAMVKAEQLAKDEDSYIAPKPEFLKDAKGLNSMQKGTLYHLVMEHIRYEEMDNGYDFKALMNDMVSQGYMTEEEADVLDINRFEAFLQTNICERMRCAALRGTLKREQPFMIGVPQSEIKGSVQGDAEQNAAVESDELVIIQGIIDAFFEEDDGIVLVDYKTDYVAEGQGEKLVQRYKVQMDYYARAIESILQKKVKEKVIYSIVLGEAIQV